MKRLIHLLIVASAMTFVVPGVFPEAARASVADTKREVERVVDELDRLHEQADILAEDWAEAEDNLRQLDTEVAAAEERVAAKQAELTSLRGDLSTVAVRSFTGAGADVLGPLFSNAELYSDGLRRDQFSRVALSVGTNTTDDLDELIADLDAEQENLEQKRAEVEVLKETIVQKRQQTEQLTAQVVERRAEAEARYQEAIVEEEERRAAAAFAKLQAEFAAQQAAVAQAAQAAQATASSSSGGGNSNSDNSSGGAATASDNNSSDNNSTPAAPPANSGGSTESAPAAAKAPAPAPAPANVPSVSGLAGIAVQAALGQQGVPYVYATSLPGVSFDCSGLTHYAWGQAGVYLPRNSRAQAASTPHVPAASAQPGDLIYYYSPISHVGIYIGGGQLVHAPNSGTVVKVSNVSWDKVAIVTRPG